MNPFFAPSRKLAAHRLAHGGPRIYDPRERALVGTLDALLRVGSRFAGLRPKRDLPEPRHAKRVLALRLDRLGDLLTTLPALEALRGAVPAAEIELAVGSWNEPVARRLPFVDRVRIVDAPWSAWGKRVRFREVLQALELGGDREIDLALDFQGDVRVVILMALAGAKLRAGYGDTGGSYLLTHPGRWEERTSWYRQNLELVRTLFPDAGTAGPIRPINFLNEEDRREAALIFRASGLEGRGRPLVGIHPSAGRRLKEWEEAKFAALIDRVSPSASIVVTGSESDRDVVARIIGSTKSRPATLLGLPLLSFAATVERLDVFVTGDTGPMHLSHSVGTPNVAIFGPSDPVRYGPDESLGLRRVVRHPVFCSPCNMIRRPPRECSGRAAPDCISGVSVDEVEEAVRALLAR